MRLPRIDATIDLQIHDSHTIQFSVDPREWADPDIGLMVLKELLASDAVFKNKVIGVPFNRDRVVAAAQDAFIPLVENGDLWWEDDLACVDVDTIKSMTCIRELARQK